MRTLSLSLLLCVSISGQTFPGGIYTALAAKDNLQTTLSSALTAGATTAVVASTTGWTANMVAYICDTTTVTSGVARCTGTFEAMLVTAVPSSVLLTLTRAYGGTTAYAHASGKAVINAPVAAYTNSAQTELAAIETALGANLANVTSSPLVLASRFNFTPLVSGAGVTVSGGNLVIGGNTLTFATVPGGVNGTDSGHYLYVSGGTGTAEGCLISGGSGTAGQTNAQIIVTCANTHSGAWSVASGSGGIYEAIVSIGATTGTFITTGTGGGTVWAAPGTYKVYGGPILLPSNVTLQCNNPESSILQSQGTTIVQTVPGSVRSAVIGCGLDLNTKNSIVALDLQSVEGGTYRNLYITNGQGTAGTQGIRFYSIVGTLLPCFGTIASCGNSTKNTVEDIHMEWGPARCLVFYGNCAAGTCASTLNVVRNMRCASSGSPMIDFVQSTDTNYLYDIDLSSTTATAGITFNSANPTVTNGVGVQYIRNLTCEGASTGTCLQFAYTSQNQVENVWNLWTTPLNYTAGNTTTTTVNNIWGLGLPSGVNQISHFSTDGFVVGSTISGLSSFIAHPHSTVTLANGANQNIALANGTFGYITGPSGAFSVGGFAGGIDGRVLYLFNSTAQAMTINDNDGSSTAANRIRTMTGANVVLPAGRSYATFVYDSVSSIWELKDVWPAPAYAYNAAGTLLPNTHTVFGTCVLGTSCAVTFTGAAAFTSTATYVCTATDQTAAAAVKVVNTSASVATFTGTGTDTLAYQCTGN